MRLVVDHRDSSRHITAAADLRGRTDECALLDTFVDAIRRGEGRSLVVRGQAGIGKTALLEYAGLHQVCASPLDRLDRLPTPQR